VRKKIADRVPAQQTLWKNKKEEREMSLERDGETEEGTISRKKPNWGKDRDEHPHR